MTAALDVSGCLEILLQKEKSENFGKALKAANLVVAPDLYVPELTNTLWKYCRAGFLSQDECMQYIRDGINYVDKFIDCRDLWQEAFSEGLNNNYSVYDMFYMVVARRYGGALITCDSVLATVCRKYGIQIGE
ncbi:MAG: type II toxin-antitoxin system VapC family toxin [Treponema sp.]|nr:type II toxin-antitoxin system VapC family toxin [Treponema sp.]